MSFADWIGESKRRYDDQPPTQATLKSLREFASGAFDRLHWAYLSTVSPVYTSTLAGETVHYFVDSRTELRRARDAIGEEPVLDWLMEAVDNATVLWDVGAYRGTYAVVAASKGASVVAFEPYPENMRALSRNAVLNDVVIDQYDIALSNEITTRTFGTGRTPNSQLRIRDDGEGVVETVRGDEIRPMPDIVKIDVEGHELAVLDGMADHLRSVERIVVEVHDGVRPGDVRARLEAAGLHVVEIDTDRRQTYLGGVRR